MEDPTALRQGSGSYQYLPLDEGAGEIRLVYLLPGPFSSPIRSDRRIDSFLPGHTPQFEALSYAWGSAENPIDIFVGSSGCYTLAVIQNLAEALPYLRLEDRPRALWIDAICVNQSDMAERTSQVKRMADIYSKATRVVVWLGPASEDSSIAIDFFNTICSKTTVDWQTFTLWRTSADDTLWTGVDVPVPLDQARSNSISTFLSRPWFERLWIWQEVRLSSGDTIVKCGSQTIRWSSVCHAILYLFILSFYHTNHDLFKARINSVIHFCNRQRRGYFRLIDLLYDTKYCKCSDPRDRIALLSLLSPSDRVPGIEADYSKTVSEVYKNVTLCTIKFSQYLEIMATAGLEQNNLGLPSWVPKWPCRATDTSLRYFVLASGQTLAADIGDQGYEGILQVTGVSVATINRAEGFKLPEYGSATNTDIGHEIRRISSWINLREPFEKDSRDLLAFCRIICADNFAEEFYPQRSDYLSLKECLKALRFVLELEGNLDGWNVEFLAHVGHYVCGRSFFVTKDGRLGLGPKAAKPGDIITVLLGGGVAFVLRPANDGYYQVIGEAYCDGFMDAEALLGPLPERFQFVMKLEEKIDNYWWGHMDRETQSFYCEDPRLGELPLGWKRRNHPSDEFWNWFVNEETGEGDERYGDPRLTVEALKQRGVDLKVFNLV